MKAYLIDGYGDWEALKEREVSDPTTKPTEVLVRIYTTTLNPADTAQASGVDRAEMPLTFPWIPGADFSGIVVATGEKVTDLKQGDAVYGYSGTGGAYAELISIDEHAVGIKPASLTDVDAASLALVGQTASQALELGGLEKGQTILIHGAAGAVGSCAVQIAHSLGAKVVATGSAESTSYLLKIGADEVIDYKTTRFETVVKDVDVVIDTIGGDTQKRSFSVLKAGGALVALNQPPSPELAAQYKVRGLMLDTKSTRSGLNQLSNRILTGVLKPNVGKVFPIAEVAMVWRDVKSLKVFGKIVFKVADQS